MHNWDLWDQMSDAAAAGPLASLNRNVKVLLLSAYQQKKMPRFFKLELSNTP